MSVEITFQPSGLTGLIAEGTYLIEAAKRMGLRLPADCHERGECTACVVSIVAGHSLLSAPTKAERRMLTEEKLGKEYRLACQVRIERSGELAVGLISESEKTTEAKDPKKVAGGTGLNQKFTTFVEREANTMFKTFDALMDKSRSLGENMFDRFANKAKSTRDRELENKRPPEHRRR